MFNQDEIFLTKNVRTISASTASPSGKNLTNHKATTRHSPLQGTGAEKRPAIVSGIVTADARPILPRL